MNQQFIDLLGEPDIIEDHYWWIASENIAQLAEGLGATIIYSHKSEGIKYYHVFRYLDESINSA